MTNLLNEQVGPIGNFRNLSAPKFCQYHNLRRRDLMQVVTLIQVSSFKSDTSKGFGHAAASISVRSLCSQNVVSPFSRVVALNLRFNRIDSNLARI